MRLVEFIMGMPITIEIPNAKQAADFETAFNELWRIDDKFSTYKPDSEVSKFARGEITEEAVSQELKNVIKACREAEARSNGYFSAWAGGRFEPSGYVKGWAVAQAGQAIEKLGFKTFCIGAGGDILARSYGEKTWGVGIQNPRREKYLTSQVFLKNGAVATSGNYARGAHIINPKTKQPIDELLSVTVTGPDIIRADMLATAGFAMGAAALDFIASQSGYEALIIDKAGHIAATSNFKDFQES